MTRIAAYRAALAHLANAAGLPPLAGVDTYTFGQWYTTPMTPPLMLAELAVSVQGQGTSEDGAIVAWLTRTSMDVWCEYSTIGTVSWNPIARSMDWYVGTDGPCGSVAVDEGETT